VLRWEPPPGFDHRDRHSDRPDPPHEVEEDSGNEKRHDEILAHAGARVGIGVVSRVFVLSVR
jgi:hypothetical protein